MDGKPPTKLGRAIMRGGRWYKGRVKRRQDRCMCSCWLCRSDHDKVRSERKRTKELTRVGRVDEVVTSRWLWRSPNTSA